MLYFSGDTPLISDQQEEQNAILIHGEQFANYLKKGLADNWSQVWCFF